ncbi:MAG: putative glycolipid-binding domain-containing protein [Marinobacter sp.]|nr:putative glycolipid-binding domain-containing protein [Marinobacter sp.]
MNNIITALWRRLDVPGHDACQFVPSKDGWTLRGSAVFLEGGQVCQLRYEVAADRSFQTREAAVAGWLGETELDLRVCAIGNGAWTVDGVDQPQLAGCVDLDLGFTPATNFLPVRRLALRVGEEAQAPAAYLAFPQLKFEVLPQCYKRVSDTAYEYQAPSAGYSGILEFSAQGIIVSYPGLFIKDG